MLEFPLTKRESNTGVFLWKLKNFSEHLFWKTSEKHGCFWEKKNCVSSEILADPFYKIEISRIENIDNVIAGNINIVIAETKLDTTFPVSQFHIDRFSKPSLNMNRTGGGVIIYVREYISNKVLSKHNLTTDIKAFFMKLNFTEDAL